MKGRRSLWWTVHHWLGLKLSLFMSFVLLTGTFATLAYEIDWLIFPPMRVVVQDRPYASWGAWAAGAETAEPGADIITLSAPVDPWFAASALMIRPSGESVYVQVDPWTGRATGVVPWGNAHRFLRNIHRHLMMPVEIGVPIVTSMGFVLLGSLVTGLVAYKKFWRGWLKWPRWRRGRPGEARHWTGRLHRWLGLWSLWFVALMAVTSVWYLVEQLGAAAPPLPTPEVGTRGADPQGPELDQVVAVARAAQPDLRIRAISFPYDGDPGIIVEGQARAILVRDRTNAVFVEPDELRALLSTRGERLGVHQRISEMADPLHFGTWGGLATKLIWFVFGLALTALSVSGVAIYSLRLKRAETQAERRGALRRAWDGLGPFAYPAAALILIAAWLTPANMVG